MRKLLALLSLSLLVFVGTGKVQAFASPTDPTVAFTSPVNGSTISGFFELSGSIALPSGSTANIRKLCLTLNGYPMTGVNFGGAPIGRAACTARG